MKVNDELLSGFLDAELPEAQMQEIRALLVEDDQLVERLAQLAQVDHWVTQHAAKIDQKPIPNEINELLTAADPLHKDNVVNLSGWRKINVVATKHAALAAGIAIFFGMGVNNWMQDDLPHLNHAMTPQIASILDTQTSGQSIATAKGAEVKPYFSFENKEGQYCRHYQLKQADASTANVACRQANDWLVVASVKTQNSNMQGQYQTASGERELAEIIDNISKGPVFDLVQENAAIANAWQAKNK
ncbi:MAG: hypothetical protein ACI9C4_000401 [Paraglaciecola sp.]|jgi:hypothetical protein